MTTKIIKLYDLLVDLNVDRQVAKAALEPILTKDEAFQVLATKEDMHQQTKWIVGALITAALGQIGVLSGIMALLLRAYT